MTNFHTNAAEQADSAENNGTDGLKSHADHLMDSLPEIFGSGSNGSGDSNQRGGRTSAISDTPAEGRLTQSGSDPAKNALISRDKESTITASDAAKDKKTSGKLGPSDLLTDPAKVVTF